MDVKNFYKVLAIVFCFSFLPSLIIATPYPIWEKGTTESNTWLLNSSNNFIFVNISFLPQYSSPNQLYLWLEGPVNSSILFGSANLSNWSPVSYTFYNLSAGVYELKGYAIDVLGLWRPIIDFRQIYPCDYSPCPAARNKTNISFYTSLTPPVVINSSTNSTNSSLVIPPVSSINPYGTKIFNISITSPENNKLYNKSFTKLYYTAYLNSTATCWYGNQTYNFTSDTKNCTSSDKYESRFSFQIVEGVNIWYVYMNNTEGKLNYSKVEFTLNTTPIINTSLAPATYDLVIPPTIVPEEEVLVQELNETIEEENEQGTKFPKWLIYLFFVLGGLSLVYSILLFTYFVNNPKKKQKIKILNKKPQDTSNAKK